MIKLTGITAGYGSTVVLRDLTAVFDRSSMTGIIGINGCGKSTLLKTILSAIPLRNGEISVDGIPLSTMDRKAIARKISYLAQEKHTPDMTVRQLVLHGRFPHLNYPRRYTRQDSSIASAAMERVGLLELADAPLHTLSGGMRQNAYIAMALAQDTDYILLDEPTTYLDISHQLSLMNTLRTLADSGKGVIVVMHDLPLAMTFSQRIVLLSNGQIVGNDTPTRICEQKSIDSIFGVSVARSADGQSYHYAY